MKNYFWAGLITLAIAIAGTFPAIAADTISVTHLQGVTEVPLNPKKVIVFDIATLDTLNELGVEVFGVPVFPAPANLKKYMGADYAKMGSLFKPDFEAINAAQPDLIIVASRSATAYKALSKIAPTIDLTNDWKNFIPSVKANSEILGKIFGKSDEIAKATKELDATIAHVKDHSSNIGKVFLVMTNGGKVTAFGPGSRLGFIHDVLGMEPAIKDVKAATHGEAISNEFILETNPDWMVVLDRDAAIGRGSGASAKQLLDNELVTQTSAWKNNHVIFVDTARWYVTNGGVINLKKIVEELSGKMLAGH